jgi:hypothetical protein
MPANFRNHKDSVNIGSLITDHILKKVENRVKEKGVLKLVPKMMIKEVHV